MARSGPMTRNTSTLALGLAQVRVGISVANIATIAQALTSTNSIGSLASTKFTSAVEYFKHESGFPSLEDFSIALSEKAALECTFEEITPFNLGLAKGLATMSGEHLAAYANANSGEIKLGSMASPEYVRMEACYTYPDGINEMVIIFPRAQATASMEIDLQKADTAKPPLNLEAKIASSDVTGGNAVWDLMPLGRIIWKPVTP
jgi:hypothetical protein